MASQIYRGGMTSYGNLQAAAEAQNVQAEVDDVDGSQQGQPIRLEGPTGEAYAGREGTRVPNLDIQHVPSPTKVSALPGNLQTSPLSSGRVAK